MALPTGIITIWSGAIVAIPTGWALCDGNNATPDLRDRFIPGAGAGLDPGDTGGASTHTHDGTTDGHNHALQANSTIATGTGFRSLVDTETDTFTTDAASSLPPYYALAYIMKT